MIRVDIIAKDIEKAVKKVEVWPKARQAGLLKLANEIRQRVIARTPEDTGTLKRSWGTVDEHESGQTSQHSGGLTFGTSVEYAPFLEEGLLPREGPKTETIGDKIYSSSAPGGIISPLIEEGNEASVIDDVLNLLIRAIEEVIDKEGES